MPVLDISKFDEVFFIGFIKKVTMPGTRSSKGYLTTQGQVIPKRNIQSSQISNTSVCLCLSWFQ